jgi:uncharacterized repeat protein (TIGR03803 family)
VRAVCAALGCRFIIELRSQKLMRPKQTPASLLIVLSTLLVSCGGSGTPHSTPPPGQAFTVTPSQQALLLMPGSSVQLPIIVLQFPGTSGTVNITISGPPEITVTPSSFSVTANTSQPTVTLNVANPLANGTYTYTVSSTDRTMSTSSIFEVAVVQPPPAPASLHANTLYSFGAQEGYPRGPLIADSAGNFYGVAGEEVFEVSNSGGAWVENVLYSFPNGPLPLGTLAMDSSGNLYGVTADGGLTGSGCAPTCGTVYELSPSANGWQLHVLYSFLGGADGDEPLAGLILDQAGNLYGTTGYGGNVSVDCNGGCGTVFTLTKSQSGWQHTVLYSFQGTTQGSTPNSTLVRDEQGNLYGTTLGGSVVSTGLGGNAICGGCGTVFGVVNSGGTWQGQTIYSFEGIGIDGIGPTALVLDSAGNLYGVSSGGFGNPQCGGTGGNVFELTPSGGSWNITQLYYFLGCNLGAPPTTLILDDAGNLYGTAGGGLSTCGANGGCGVVFKLSQNTPEWDITEIDDFTGGASGYGMSYLTLVAGKLYGVTAGGGASNSGTVFEITP